uniref:Retinal guanylyl cyclase 2 n=1 Tax=Schistocephalus solidus TaxID=70667 RepID=A0A0X3NNG8_SCHSO
MKPLYLNNHIMGGITDEDKGVSNDHLWFISCHQTFSVCCPHSLDITPHLHDKAIFKVEYAGAVDFDLIGHLSAYEIPVLSYTQSCPQGSTLVLLPVLLAASLLF